MAAVDVKVGSVGLCEIAPLGTTLPTDGDASLDAAFLDYGEISQDGLEAAFDVTTTTVKNWTGQVLRTLNTETTVSFKLSFMETTEEVLELFYGQAMESQTTASRILLTNPDVTPVAVSITITDQGDDSFKRYILERCVVSEREAVTDKADGASMFTCTLTALYSDTLSGYGYVQFPTDLV